MRQKLFFFFLCCLYLTGAGKTYANMAFVANVSGNWDLFIADANGENPIQITDTLHDEKTPSWSPDKSKIVYTTSNGHLNIIDVSTKEHQRIPTTQLPIAPHITPSFSPDGQQISFARFKPGEKDDTVLMVYDTENKSITPLLDQPSFQADPTWSPDGQKIVYASSLCGSECGRIIQELWVTESNGGWARQLLMTHSLCRDPSWSPDGAQIAYSSDQNGNLDIWLLSLESWKTTPLTTHEDLDVSPSWSPDGKKIAFISTRTGHMEIWIKDLQTGELRNPKPFGNRIIDCKDVAW